jgi:hypothetical protein
MGFEEKKSNNLKGKDFFKKDERKKANFLPN